MSNYFLDAKRKKGKHINTKKLNRDLEWRQRVSEKRKLMCDHLRGKLEFVSKCPICDSPRYELFTVIFDYPYHECKNCGHIFLATPPSEQAIKDLYSGKGENRTIQGDIYIGEDIFRERIQQIARPKIEFCLEHIERPSLWIDVGCGTGEILEVLKEENIPAIGIESDIEEVQFARSHNLKVTHADFTTIEEDLFSATQCVSFINILEHIKDPVRVIGNIVRHLPDFAYVIIEVPRHPSLSSYNNLAFSSLSYRHIYAPDHLHVFTESSLKLLFGINGLKEIAIWEYGQDFQDLICMSAISAGLKENNFIRDIMDMFNNIQQSIDDLGFSDTMFVIGRKNGQQKV